MYDDGGGDKQLGTKRDSGKDESNDDDFLQHSVKRRSSRQRWAIQCVEAKDQRQC